MRAGSFGKTVRDAHLYNNFIQATNALSHIIDKHLEYWRFYGDFYLRVRLLLRLVFLLLLLRLPPLP
jgi:hypothetical protein